MKKPSVFSRIQAAYSLSIAMNEGRAPDQESIKTLGLDPKVVEQFKR